MNITSNSSAEPIGIGDSDLHLPVSELELLRAASLGLFDRAPVFVDIPPASVGKYAVICNSVPKAGTYLLLELLKAFGQHTDVGYHAYSTSLRRVRPNGSIEGERQIPALMSASNLKPGYLCAAHIAYSPYFEEYLHSRPDLRMIFIIRDPRDLVISWVDFVYNSVSYPKMSAWNAFHRELGTAYNPDDASRIAGTIEALPRTGISEFVGWIASPACLTVKFEDIYSELTANRGGFATSQESNGTIGRIAEYLDLGTKDLEQLKKCLGSSLTASGRAEKIDIYRKRMNEVHIGRLREPVFQKLVIDFGYKPTVGLPSPQACDREAPSKADVDHLKRQLKESLAERDAAWTSRDEAIAHKEQLARELIERIAERDAAWTSHDEAIAHMEQLTRELIERIAERDKAWTSRDEAIAHQKHLASEMSERVAERDAAWTSRDEAIAHQEHLVRQLSERVAERDAAWTSRDEAIAHQKHLASELSERVAERDAAWTSRDEAIAHQKHLASELSERVAERDAAWTSRDEAIAHQKHLASELSERVAERDAAWTSRDEAIAHQEHLVCQLSERVAERDAAWTSRDEAIAHREHIACELSERVAERDAAWTSRDEAIAHQRRPTDELAERVVENDVASTGSIQ